MTVRKYEETVREVKQMIDFYGEIVYNLGSISPIKYMNGRTGNAPFVASAVRRSLTMINDTTNPSQPQDSNSTERPRIYFQIILDVREEANVGMVIRDAQGNFWLSYSDAKDLQDCLTEYLKHGENHITEQHRAGVYRFLNPSREPQPKPERKPKPGYIYLLRSEVGHYKIGMTTAPEKRLHTFGVKLPFRVEYTCLIQTDDTVGLERQLQRKFGEKRLDGEWFDLSPEDVEYIKGLAS